MAEAHFLEVILPEQANHYGTLFGPNALHIMGKAAFACAARHARCAVVMAKADSIEFRRPVRIGTIVDVHARIVFQGRSSMTAIVELAPDSAEDTTPAVTGRFMMVAVDRDGVPVPIPPSDTRIAEGAHP